MPRKPKNIHYVYKTINLINQKYYIGVHSTHNIDDGYLGSGRILRYSIRKYGKENFKREILEFCIDRDEMFKREKDIVNQEMLQDILCMNLKPGGSGNLSGNSFFKGTIEEKIKYSEIKSIKQKEWIKNNKDLFHQNCKKASIKIREKYSKGFVNPFKNKIHTEETLLKMSLSKKGKIGLGKTNSQFGSMWITNGIENKKIKKDTTIPNNWYKGRVASQAI